MVSPITHGTHAYCNTPVDVTFRIPNHLILYFDDGSFRLPAKFNLTIKLGCHVILFIIPAICILEAKENDESSASGNYQRSRESEESGESSESKDFEESGESGDFVESGESGDFEESGESGNFEDSGESGDYEESGESSDRSISKRNEIPTETQKGMSHILHGC